jgi:hypothetical protein
MGEKMINYFVGVIDSLETVVAFTFTDYNNIIISGGKNSFLQLHVYFMHVCVDFFSLLKASQ